MRAEQVQEAAPAFVHMWYKGAHTHGGNQQCISSGLSWYSCVLGHGTCAVDQHARAILQHVVAITLQGCAGSGCTIHGSGMLDDEKWPFTQWKLSTSQQSNNAVHSLSIT